MTLLGYMSSSTTKRSMMIGIHLGMIFPALFAAVFLMQARDSASSLALSHYLLIVCPFISTRCLAGSGCLAGADKLSIASCNGGSSGVDLLTVQHLLWLKYGFRRPKNRWGCQRKRIDYNCLW
jgi:hypothetical protein